MGTENLSPVKSSERQVILDALRGFAILGICMANYPEFSLYTFQSEAAVAAMPTAEADRILRFLLYMFVDGKFYTIFFFALRHRFFHHHDQCRTQGEKRFTDILPADACADGNRFSASDVHLER